MAELALILIQVGHLPHQLEIVAITPVVAEEVVVAVALLVLPVQVVEVVVVHQQQHLLDSQTLVAAVVALVHQV
jgi:hypothetical protein